MPAEPLIADDERDFLRPVTGAVAVTPADGADLAKTARGLWVGGAGTVKVTLSSGDTVTFSGVPAGTRLDVAVTRVWETGTTATLILALY